MSPISISAAAALHPAQRANFATASRLLSCLVTESLVDALYLPCPLIGGTYGIAVVFRNTLNTDVKPSLQDLLAIVHLHHEPVFKESRCIPGSHAIHAFIGLLDPLDMLPIIHLPYELNNQPISETDAVTLEPVQGVLSKASLDISLEKTSQTTDPLRVWSRFSERMNLDEEIKMGIASELSSSVKWQEYSFEHPAEAPSFSSPSIAWEQSIVNGHPTHPMHKTRAFLPPLPDFAPGDYDLHRPRLRFVSASRSDVKILYDFEVLTKPLIAEAFACGGQSPPPQDDRMIIPVHELQIAHIMDKFPDITIYPENVSLPLLAQQSLRSVVIPGSFSDSGLQLKLGFGVKLTSAVRTISPESAFFGPHFSKKVVPALAIDREILDVAKELGSVVHAHPDGNIAKHCAAIVRECYETVSERKGERLIVCTSLVEYGHTGTDKITPSVVRVFGLDTLERRCTWFREFVSVFLNAFLPPMIQNGVAFECHPQNCVARFDIVTRALKGFIIRDFGGLKVHPATLKKTTGIDLDYVEGHSVISSALEDVYTRMYHTVFHNHFQQLVRVLDIHYNGLGWEIVRQELGKVIPTTHPLFETWLSPERTTFPGKCFMRMRMVGAYRFHMHGPFPNLLHYTGKEESPGNEAVEVTRSSN